MINFHILKCKKKMHLYLRRPSKGLSTEILKKCRVSSGNVRCVVAYENTIEGDTLYKVTADRTVNVY